MTQQLIGYSAFWCSDQSWGFGASLLRDEQSPEFFDTFVEQVETLGRDLYHHTDMTADEAIGQLRGFAQQYNQLKGPELSDAKVALLVLMFGNVKFLMLSDALPIDEYNGLHYAYLM